MTTTDTPRPTAALTGRCRLVLTINGKSYTLRRTNVAGADRAFIVRGEGSVYVVSSRRLLTRCTCEGWKYRNTCKHVRSLEALGVLP